MRILCLVGALWIAGCGGRQSSSSTTVSSGGADITTPTPTETVPVAEPEVVSSDPVDLDDFAREPMDEEEPEPAVDLTEEPKRRNLKMTSYEEAMAMPIELGDVTTEGGEAQLSAERIARVMDGHLDDMYEECIRKELERDNALGTVTMDLAIRGRDGRILGVTIEPGRRRFKSCLESYLEDVRFPKFASPRMGARYRFHAG